MKTHRWSDIPLEQMNPAFGRRVIHSARMTVARVILSKGSVVPRHSHENEQLSIVEKGVLKFYFDNGEEFTVAAGEVMEIPSHAPHKVEALEDSEGYDLFAPVREDWLRGDDSYLRR
ncbi:MAG: cupin domain-containing protein [Acidobacteria bacterium]|nr:cupin domain-containing protein [Acidobacteriota bacterium]